MRYSPAPRVLTLVYLQLLPVVAVRRDERAAPHQPARLVQQSPLRRVAHRHLARAAALGGRALQADAVAPVVARGGELDRLLTIGRNGTLGALDERGRSCPPLPDRRLALHLDLRTPATRRSPAGSVDAPAFAKKEIYLPKVMVKDGAQVGEIDYETDNPVPHRLARLRSTAHRRTRAVERPIGRKPAAAHNDHGRR